MIKLPREIYDGIVAQARRELPNEACGLLAGIDGEVKQRYELTNVDHSPEHFSFDPAEQFRVLRAARAEGLKIVANYHSHPVTPSRPSEEDIRLAYDQHILYLIVSLASADATLKAFRIVGGISTEVELQLV